MFDLAAKVPGYWSLRALGRPRRLPLSLTVSVTYHCNSRCLTCNVYERKEQEFTRAEFGRVFGSVGKGVYWITFSGGEAFLRADFGDIVCDAHDACRPKVINIPTNGLLRDSIPAAVERIVGHCPDTEIIVNLSMDDVGERDDTIRGVKGAFERAMDTYRGLRELRAGNLTVGIHTVISKYNVDRIPQIYEYVQGLKPDSYITEVAEERAELRTIGADITPGPDQYARAVKFLADRIRRSAPRGVSRLTQSLRLQYYQTAERVLREKRQVIPCYAGVVSGQIAPNGDVWACCVRGESLGNLREHDFDFRSIWFGKEAKRVRESIRKGECHCPLANAAYTNMLHHPPSMMRVCGNYLVWR